jgi:hypothetical protein
VVLLNAAAARAVVDERKDQADVAAAGLGVGRKVKGERWESAHYWALWEGRGGERPPEP